MKSLRFFEMQTRYLALLYGVLCTLALGSCHDKEVPDPNAACKGKSPFTANFEMYAGNNIPVSQNGTVDTFYSGIQDFGTSITFKAAGYVGYDVDSLKWTIGYDNRTFTQPQFYLRFPAGEGEIPVRLIQYGPKNKSCFPNDDGVDTVYKRFYLKNGESPFAGNFQGALASRPNDTFTVYLTAFPGNRYADKGYFLYNFPKGNKGLQPGTTESLGGQGNELRVVGKYFSFATDYGITSNSNPDLYAGTDGRSYGIINKDTLTTNLSFGPSVRDSFRAIRKR